MRSQQAIPFPVLHVDGEVIVSRAARELAPLTSATGTAYVGLPFVFLSKSCGKFTFPPGPRSEAT